MNDLLIKLAEAMESHEEKQSDPQIATGDGTKGINTQNTSSEDSSMRTEDLEKKEKKNGENKEENKEEEAPEQEGGKPVDLSVVIDFFVSNPSPNDSVVHNFTKANGLDTHQFESMAYKLATISSEILRSGKMNESGFDITQIDPEQLSMGMEIEKEHTPNDAIAKKIALDHLAEIPDYYARLAQMEEQFKTESNAAAVPQQPQQSQGNESESGDRLEERNGGYETVQEPYTYIPFDQQSSSLR